MARLASQISVLATVSLLTALSGFSGTAKADDSEIFIKTENVTGATNIMLIIDTSGSMYTKALSASAQVVYPYDSRLSYPDSGSNGTAGCQSDRIYFRPDDLVNTEPPSSCAGLYSFKSSSNQCDKSRSSLQFGNSTYKNRTGNYQGTFVRWFGTRNDNRDWTSTLGSADDSGYYDLECKEDAGSHGNGGSAKYPRSGPTSGTGYWGTSSTWWNSHQGTKAVLWSPNLIRYTLNPTTTVTVDKSRMTVVKEAAKNLLNSPALSGMNVGLMRYDTQETGFSTQSKDSAAEGGMVLWPALPIDQGTNRQQLIQLIDDLVEAGNTPLSETLYEAYKYFAGGTVEYGATSKICTNNGTAAGSAGNTSASCSTNSLQDKPSVASSRRTDDSSRYQSPIDSACQKNYIIFLTDGLPTSDGSSTGGIRGKVEALVTNRTGLPESVSITNACDTTRAAHEGQCLTTLSEFMSKTDLHPDDTPVQSVKTYFIGFGDSFAGDDSEEAFGYLKDASEAAGAEAYQANDLVQLEGAFNSVLATVVDTNSTFTAPTVAVNAFNRTQTLSDLYVAVFQPSTHVHWPGNLKKYKIDGGIIKDKNGQEAVDSETGFFKAGAHDIWASSTSGSAYDVTTGGAANLIPAPGSRKVYTYLAANPASPVTLGTTHEFNTTNITDTDLGLGDPGDPSREDLINWARGQDIPGTGTRDVMGDPMHAQPAVVIYGGSATDPEGVVFVPTNDGYLHAINAKTGVELWSFIPKEIVNGKLKRLYQNPEISTKEYMLDGEVQVLKFDANGDGTVNGNDRVIIYFGQARGGDRYYALDVTNKNSPKFMWSLSPPDAGKTWSPVTTARVAIGNGSQQNNQKLVLIMGGGYDTAEDDSVVVTSSPVGNRIYMVDALKGTVLWSAGPTSSTANLKLERMDHSIPSRITVMDTDQDGLADRMYVGDMGGQLWRFDIINSTATNEVDADDLVRGGVIASLGAKDLASDKEKNARRFYNAPDVAAMQNQGGRQYFNIAIGSGWRGKPTKNDIDDRFYSIRDYLPFRAMTQDEYDDVNDDPLSDSDLIDITDDVSPNLAANAVGWKLRLGTGEKVLSDSTTFDRRVFFTTFTPSASSNGSACIANSTGGGTNRAYIVNVADGSPVMNMRDSEGSGDEEEDGNGSDDGLTADDRSTDLRQGGIAAGVTFLFPEPNKLVCLSGVEVLGACSNFNSRVKTYWREEGAN